MVYVVDFNSLVSLIIPQSAGFAIGMYLIWRIASNALHGIAKSQEGMAVVLGKISGTLTSHAEADAKVFSEILTGITKQNDALIRLEERTARRSS